MELKVMTYNVQHCENYLTHTYDFDGLAGAIASYAPDIVGLNEMRDLGAHPEHYQAQAKLLAEKAGFPYWYFAKAIDFDGVDPYGNAILSRFPLKKAETIMIPDPAVKDEDCYYETRCLLHVVAETPAGDLDVFVTHFGLAVGEEKNAAATVCANVKEKRCLLMGDFNLMPSSPILTPIRESMCDTASVSTELLYTYPSDAPDRKIDYIFTSRDVKTLSVEVPPLLNSDHRPLFCRLSL